MHDYAEAQKRAINSFRRNLERKIHKKVNFNNAARDWVKSLSKHFRDSFLKEHENNH